MNLRNLMESAKEKAIKAVKAKIKIWIASIVGPVIPIVLIAAVILSVGALIIQKIESFFTGKSAGYQYTMSDADINKLSNDLVPELKQLGISDEKMDLKKEDIKTYIKAQQNSLKSFGSTKLQKTTTYSVTDPQDGVAVPKNETQNITFSEKDKIAPFVLGPMFYISLDIGTQNDAFAKALAQPSTGDGGGIQITKSDATFTDIYSTVVTKTTTKWEKTVTQEPAAPSGQPGRPDYVSYQNGNRTRGFSTLAALNYMPIYNFAYLNNRLAIVVNENGDDPGTIPEPAGNDPVTTPNPSTKTETHTMVITKTEKIPEHVLTRLQTWSKIYTWEYTQGPEVYELVSDNGTTKVETWTTSYDLSGYDEVENTDKFKEIAAANGVNPVDFTVSTGVLEKSNEDADNVEDLKNVQSEMTGQAPIFGGGGVTGDLPSVPLQPGDSAGADKELSRYPLPQLYQHDPRWGRMMYSAVGDPGQTIAASGCGPSSAAIVLTGMTGSIITPPMACNYSLSHGFRTANSGTSWGFFASYAGTFGIHVTQVTVSSTEKSNYALWYNVGSNLAKIIQALNNQDPIIVSQGPGYFTKGGHYHVWGGFDSQNRVIVIDPNKRSGHYDLSMALENAKTMFIFTK